MLIAELKIRHLTCNTCGTSHDRDANAAHNVLVEGLRLLAIEHYRDTDGRRLKASAEPP
ncbi:MAG: hypothetical protein ACYDHP_09850 [Ferrimicrobium sp.]